MSGLSQRRNRPPLAFLLLIPMLSACTLGVPGNDAEQDPQSGPTSIVPFEQGQSVWPPNDATVPPPSRAADATYVEFESGWAGAAVLPATGETECTIHPRSGDRHFTARTSEFGQFDSGSENPGADFWVEVSVYGDGSENIPTPSGEENGTFRLNFVEQDGTHRDMAAWESSDLKVMVDDAGVGFAATSVPSGSDVTSTVTGYVACASVEQYP